MRVIIAVVMILGTLLAPIGAGRAHDHITSSIEGQGQLIHDHNHAHGHDHDDHDGTSGHDQKFADHSHEIPCMPASYESAGVVVVRNWIPAPAVGQIRNAPSRIHRPPRFCFVA